MNKLRCIQKALLLLALVAGALGVSLPPARAQVFGSGHHTVTVQVSPITAVAVSGGSVSLAITAASAVAGQDQLTITDKSTQLLWGTNSSSKKITVMTNLAAPLFTLKLLALNPTQGTAAAQVTLTTTAQDFLLNIGRSSGTATLQYTGVALASKGTGSDAHVITFTVATQ